MDEFGPLAHVSVADLWDAASDGFALVDADGLIVATNTSFDQLFGYLTGDLLGRSVDTLVPIPRREAHAQDRTNYARTASSRPMSASPHLRGLRADGSTFYINVSLAPINTDQGRLVFAAVRDLTQGVEREAEVAKSNRLRAIAEDHERIASELHDTTIQRLFALGLGLQGLPAQIDDEAISARINSAVDTLDEVITEIRNTIHGLRDHRDPAATLRQRVVGLVSEMEAVLGFAPEIRFNGDIDSIEDESVIGHLLPVLREGLSNIARHAGATTATVTLVVGETLTLEVQDDGCGIKDNVVRSGLANMADRAVALEGTFVVAPATPQGTYLCWSVPRVGAD